jgi:hypothetical protein
LARSITRLLRAVRLVATDSRIPRPLRALVAIGVMPIPGPFDEAVLLLAAVLLFVFYRPVLRDALRAASGDRQSSAAPASST